MLLSRREYSRNNILIQSITTFITLGMIDEIYEDVSLTENKVYNTLDVF